MNKFGNVVKHYLIENSLQQTDLAASANTTPATVSKLLTRDNISLDKMLMIADALDCDLEIKLVPKNKGE